MCMQKYLHINENMITYIKPEYIKIRIAFNSIINYNKYRHLNCMR